MAWVDLEVEYREHYDNFKNWTVYSKYWVAAKRLDKFSRTCVQISAQNLDQFCIWEKLLKHLKMEAILKPK